MEVPTSKTNRNLYVSELVDFRTYPDRACQPRQLGHGGLPSAVEMRRVTIPKPKTLDLPCSNAAVSINM